MKRSPVSADGETIVVHIPMTFRKRGGRKLIATPDGAPWAPRPRVDNALVKALARGFRWRRMLDDGVCATIEDLAKREKVNRGYMSRVLRLTLLAPDVVEAILDGRQSAVLQLDDLLAGFPLEWERQRRLEKTSDDFELVPQHRTVRSKAIVPGLPSPSGRRSHPS